MANLSNLSSGILPFFDAIQLELMDYREYLESCTNISLPQSRCGSIR
ncbi:MAG: hypothetical protein LBD79_08890 [Treponema sp.]|nr:hypothetical protein [Treponema sp.]